jgi:hypothetical protein
VGGQNAELVRDAAVVQLLDRRLHAFAVGLRADEDADEHARRFELLDDRKGSGSFFRTRHGAPP